MFDLTPGSVWLQWWLFIIRLRKCLLWLYPESSCLRGSGGTAGEQRWNEERSWFSHRINQGWILKLILPLMPELTNNQHLHSQRLSVSSAVNSVYDLHLTLLPVLQCPAVHSHDKLFNSYSFTCNVWSHLLDLMQLAWMKIENIRRAAAGLMMIVCHDLLINSCTISPFFIKTISSSLK